MFVLDTDVLSLYLRGDRRLLLRLRAMPTAQPTTTIVTVQEMLQGRLAQVRRARTGHDRVSAYAWLQRTVEVLSGLLILPFDDAAEAEFSALSAGHLRLGSQDGKIAAIALSRRAILVSRNLQHFQSIPALRVQDWTVDEPLA
ncbi:hypothetical protein CKO31_16580 [Thiohalocapsa halophila]|uniref:PIN domain-containing protein n=1 Tax=Thiohalocapsa halophila TaxID=69359 RepID=A0ABS1CKV8_9GAMM|nr:PIN domain-containing protein [Thiohalocapsa halophila]MBK1632323.1 hypothetical protein [Thiohalocapsa halophila]